MAGLRFIILEGWLEVREDVYVYWVLAPLGDWRNPLYRSDRNFRTASDARDDIKAFQEAVRTASVESTLWEVPGDD